MNHLLDVNFLLACARSGHADHIRANRWLNSSSTFAMPEAFQSDVFRSHNQADKPRPRLLRERLWGLGQRMRFGPIECFEKDK